MNQDLLVTLEHHVQILTLNRIEKHNAFDDTLIERLQAAIDEAESNPEARVILLRANGSHFSAGADLSWMKKMASFSETENEADAKKLAQLLSSIHHCKKPTVALVQGASFGGGAGLVAACDIAIAADTSQFCFSEVKLGLIPSVISPYVIRAIGRRRANWLFMSAERFNADTALNIGLVHHVVPEEELAWHGHEFANNIALLAPEAVRETKALVFDVADLPIDQKLQALTAKRIAKRRASAEAQKGMHAFLNKKTPVWDE